MLNLVEFGQINIIFLGKHITIATHSRPTIHSLEAAEILSKEGIEVEVVNLRTLRPLDEETIINSVKKTHHLITAESGWPQCGMGSEICARIMESKLFFKVHVLLKINSILKIRNRLLKPLM